MTTPIDQLLNSLTHSHEDFDSLVTSEDFLHSEPLLRLIGFAHKKAGGEVIPNLSFIDSNLATLLDVNNIPYRPISLPADISSVEHPLVIVKNTDNKYFAIYRDNGRNFLYDPYSNSKAPFSKEAYSLIPDAYEVYPSLPHSTDNALDVAFFSLRGLWVSVVIFLFCILFVMLISLFYPLMTQYLVSQILPEDNLRLLVEGLVIGLIIVSASVVLLFLQQIQILRIETFADLKLQTSVLHRLLILPVSTITSFTAADLSSRVMGISKLRALLSAGLITTLLSLSFAFIYLVLMYIYDFELALWSTVLVLFSLVYASFLVFYDVKFKYPLIETTASTTNQALQSILGIVQIRVNAAEHRLLTIWKSQLKSYLNIQLKQLIVSDLFSSYNSLLTTFGTLLLFSLVVTNVYKGKLSPEQWLVIYVSFSATFSAFNRILVNSFNIIKSIAGEAIVLWGRATPILFASPEPGYSSEASFHPLIGEYQLSQIQYRYPDASQKVLNNLSMSFPALTHTGITGPSGCGKSTVIRLLLGFIEPDHGSIRVDNTLLSKISIRNYRSQLGVVMQDFSLPNGSIKKLLSYDGRFSDDEIWHSLELSQLADDVHSMPMKLDTILNVGATNISGGQRQRLALSRALIKQPKVLFLDEATSALDAKTQSLFVELVSSLPITRISVAHRLSTLQHCDSIFVLDKGSVLTQGNWASIASDFSSPPS